MAANRIDNNPGQQSLHQQSLHQQSLHQQSLHQQSLRQQSLRQQSPRQRKQLERKARVIEAALRLAADGGYEAVQMREVAARSGVALGTIYRYFSSKDAVLVAGMAGWVGLARKRIAAEGIVAAAPADQLIAVLDSAVDASVVQPRLMAALITALASTEPEVAEHKMAVEQEMAGLFSDALGGFEGVDVDGVSRVIGHVWFSSIVSWVGGVRPASSVMDELSLAAHLLLDREILD